MDRPGWAVAKGPPSIAAGCTGGSVGAGGVQAGWGGAALLQLRASVSPNKAGALGCFPTLQRGALPHWGPGGG